MLISGVALLQRVLSCFRVLLSLHSPQKGKLCTEWVLLRVSSAVMVNEGKRKAELCGMHIKNLCAEGFNEGKTNATLCGMQIKPPCTVGFKERGRKMREGNAFKYSWEAFRILYSHE